MAVKIQYEVSHKITFNSEQEACEYAAKIAKNISDEEIVEISKITHQPDELPTAELMAYLENYNGLAIEKREYYYLAKKYEWD